MKNKFQSYLLLLSALFLFTRIYNLGNLPIFQDESAYISLALKIADSPFSFWDAGLILPVAKPPLFMILQAIFIKIIPDFLIASRLTSVAFGMASMLGIVKISQILFDKKTAFIAGLLYIISPFTLTYDRLAIMETALASFGIWLVYFALVFPKNWKLNGIFISLLSGLALLTKQSATIIFPIVVLSNLANSYYPKYKNLIRNTIKILIFLLLGAILSKMLIFSQNYQIYSDFRPADFTDFGKDNFIKILTTNLSANVSWLKSYLTIPIFGLTFLSFIFLLKSKKQFLILGLWFIIPTFVQSLLVKNLFPRYELVAFAPLIISLSYFINLLIKRKNLFSMAIFLLFIPQLIFSFNILYSPSKALYHYNERWQLISNWPSGYGIKETANYIQKNIDQSAVIYVEGSNGHLKDSLNLYLKGYKIIAFDRDTIPSPPEEKTILIFNNKPGILIQNENYRLIHSEIKPYLETAVEIYTYEPHN